jgi:hypothetical protein
MTSMDEQGRPEAPLAGWDTVDWETDPTGIGTWPPKTPLSGSMRSGRTPWPAPAACAGWARP